MQLEDALTTVEHQLQVISAALLAADPQALETGSTQLRNAAAQLSQVMEQISREGVAPAGLQKRLQAVGACSRFSVRAWPAWRPSPTGKPQVCYPPQMLPPHMEAPWAGAMPAVWPASTGLRAENLRRCAVVCAPGARWSATHPNKPPASVAAHFCAKAGNRLAVQLAHP